MKLIKMTAAALAMTAFAATAQAQDSGAYVNVGVETFEFDTYNILGRVGYNFSENFGFEGEGSFGVIGTEEFGEDIDTDWSLGGYIVGRIPVGENFEIFARVGYRAVNFSVEDIGSETFDGVAYGGGVQWNFDEFNGIRLGYTGADLGVVGTADIVDLAYVRKF